MLDGKFHLSMCSPFFLILQGNLTRPQEMTSDDILGDPVPSNQQETMRNFCYQALKMNVKVGTLRAFLFSAFVIIVTSFY